MLKESGPFDRLVHNLARFGIHVMQLDDALCNPRRLSYASSRILRFAVKTSIIFQFLRTSVP